MARKNRKKPAVASKPRATARNRYATHPLMKKGGVHQKTRKAERKSRKQQLRSDYPVLTLSLAA